MFWEEFFMLKCDNDVLYKKICDFCSSICWLRELMLKDEIDCLY